MNSWDHCIAVERDSLKVSGAWVFTNTRVPARALFDNLEDGAAFDPCRVMNEAEERRHHTRTPELRKGVHQSKTSWA
jgi:hypothetical protein